MSVSASHLRSNRCPITVELGVGLDVVGVYCQSLRVELVGRLEVSLLERFVPFLLLGFQGFGVLWEQNDRSDLDSCRLGTGLYSLVSDSTHSARQTGLVVVGGHAQSLDEELDGFVNAVLVIEAEATHVQRVCVC